MTVIPIVMGALGTIPKGLVKELEDFVIKRQVETIQTDYSIIKIGKNTEKSLGDMRRLTVIQT